MKSGKKRLLPWIVFWVCTSRLKCLVVCLSANANKGFGATRQLSGTIRAASETIERKQLQTVRNRSERLDLYCIALPHCHSWEDQLGPGVNVKVLQATAART